MTVLISNCNNSPFANASSLKLRRRRTMPLNEKRTIRLTTAGRSGPSVSSLSMKLRESSYVSPCTLMRLSVGEQWFLWHSILVMGDQVRGGGRDRSSSRQADTPHEKPTALPGGAPNLGKRTKLLRHWTRRFGQGLNGCTVTQAWSFCRRAASHPWVPGFGELGSDCINP